MAAYLGLVGFQIIGVKPEDVYFRSACDKDKHALQALKTLHPKCRPEHINEDINDLLTEEAKTKLGVFEASINKALAAKLADNGITFANKKEAKQLPPEAKEIVKEHGTAMLDGYMEVFTKMENPFIDTPACKAAPDGYMHLLFMGTECTDYSTVGATLQLAGPTSRTFAISLEYMRRLRPHVTCHECTRTHDMTIFQKYLPGFHIARCVTDARKHGWPARRQRSYSAIHDTEKCDLVDPLDTYRSLYASTSLDAGVFFSADNEAIERERRTVAASVCKPSNTSFLDLIPKRKAVALQSYTRLDKVQQWLSEGRNVVGCLDQIPEFTDSMVAPEVPCLLASGKHMWSWKHERYLLGTEWLQTQGIPVYQKALQYSQLDQQLYTYEPPATAERHLAGMGFHIPTMGSFFMAVLVSARIITKPNEPVEA